MSVLPDAARPTRGIALVEGLRSHAGRTALIGPDGAPVGYAELADRVESVAACIGPGRRLVLLTAGTDAATVVGLLAALHGGHPLLVVARDDHRAVASLTATYDPDVVLAGDEVRPRRAESRHDLHPDLALLLSTSGSTGSPRLVRLGREAVQANAESIAGYLGIRATDRAVVSLPLHYCYGFSVVTSNLLRGAALLLPGHPVTDTRFWTAVREHRATSLHGVPYTFELLDRVGFADLDLPSLRYVTQAGGRLPAADVVRYAELGASAGWRFFVMYGQTEATARMAYLPPHLAASRPTAIGVAIPGGAFELAGCGDDGVGELVYRGPNVMLGYADGPADLALGRTVDALRTGDLARRGPDGLYELTGRASRFVKLLGLRIDLDQVERMLAAEGCTAVCTGDDTALVVGVTGGADPGEVGNLVADRIGLPPEAVRVVALAAIPRLANGKIDYPALRCHEPARPARCRDRRPRSVREAFRVAFGTADLPDDVTFVELGGDSLSWVRVSVALERVLGHLPERWDTTPIGELDALAPRRRAVATMETGVVLRAVAIVLVVGSHVGLFRLLGGAHVLLVVAGWAFARFVLAPAAPERASARILRSLARITVPSVLWILGRAAVEPDVEAHNALLLNAVLDPSAWGYWFVEVLVQILLLAALAFSVPAVRRWERTWPYGFAVAALLVALAARGLAPDNEFTDRVMTTSLVLWLFVLGWAVQRATTLPRRLLLLGLAAVLLPGFFDDPRREVLVAVGVALLVLVPRLPLPRGAVRAVGLVADASLYIYLTHYALYPLLLEVLPPAAVVAACVLAGIGVNVGVGRAIAATGLLRRGWPARRRVAVT